MHLTILSVGEPKLPFIREGEREFTGRVRHYGKVSLLSVRGEKVSENSSVESVRLSEGRRLLESIPAGSLAVALDAKGRQVDSPAFAGMLKSWRDRGVREAVFIIGGPLGLHPSVIGRADMVLSLSKMTFTHEMARLILLEQIYRAFTILRGESYHK